MGDKRIKRVSRGYHYFFVKPGRNSDAHKAAEKLMRIEDVEEVSITEGDYGFVVKAQEPHENGKDILDSITKAVGGNSARAVCHCKYIRT
jgi:hypothetical protein